MGTYEDIRASVRALAAGFPGESWRALDRERGYRTAFVPAMTEAGFLSVLIPEADMATLLAADGSWQAADMCLQTHVRRRPRRGLEPAFHDLR